MSQNTLSPSASDGERHAELDEPELLRRILRLDDLAVTGSLHAESLLDLLWISMPELRCYLRDKIPYVLATQGLIRSLARAGLAREASADPEALARLLFLAHSRGDGAVTGAAFIDRAGGLSSHRILFSGSADESGAAVREMMRLALVLDAAVLVFHIRADGDCSPRATHRALHARICAAAELLDVPVVDSWIVAGPSQWASLTDWAAEPRRSPANEDPARRGLTARESIFAESDLGIAARRSHFGRCSP
jgi:hypothetical protein